MCVVSVVSLNLQPIFIISCMAFVPACILSSELRSDKRNATTARNTQGTTIKFHVPRKHATRNKRPAIHMKERGPVNLTRWPTNSEKVRLFGRVGRFLFVNANGTISGSLNQHSKFGECGGLNTYSFVNLFSSAWLTLESRSVHAAQLLMKNRLSFQHSVIRGKLNS